MNSTQRKAIEQLIKESNANKQDPINLPLHQFESLLDLSGDLVALNLACYPEEDDEADSANLAEWQGKKSHQLWCLMESYDDYDRKDVPSNCLEYLKAKVSRKMPKLSEKKAKVICELFVMVNVAHMELKSKRPKSPEPKLVEVSKAVEIVAPELSLSDAISSLFKASEMEFGKRMMTMFSRFLHAMNQKIDNKESITKEFLIEAWTKASGMTIESVRIALAKEEKRTKNEGSKLKAKAEQAHGPFCGHVYGKKSEKKGGKVCGLFCANKTMFRSKKGDMINLCNKHIRNAATKHTCQMPGANGLCGKRVADTVLEPFAREGTWKDVSYCGLWLCKQHEPLANKNLDKADHPCSYKGSKTGKRCDKVAQKDSDGNWTDKCASHNKKGKKSGKKAADQRKALKKGKDKSKKSKKGQEKEDEVVVSEIKDDDKTSENAESKSSESKRPAKSGKPAKQEESDSESEDIDNESGSDSENENDAEPLTVELKFDLKKPADQDWVLRKSVNEDNDAFNFFVDRNSGLVGYNEDDTSSEEASNSTLTPLGIWDNDVQSYLELSEDAKKYAKKIGIGRTK